MNDPQSNPTSPVLESEEYVEQAFLYRTLAERLSSGEAIQDLLMQVKEEILATTKLPLAIDFIYAELNHSGLMSTAMERIAHYFNPFQTYLVSEAERDSGRFDLRTALAILEQDALGKSEKRSLPATFFYQFEAVCRCALRYDYGLTAMAKDPIYSADWSKWILEMRRKIGTVTLADLVYVHSEHYLQQQSKRGLESFEVAEPILFGEKEGKIALANRRKEPLYFFSALQRQLKYPPVPKPKKVDENADLVPRLVRQIDRLEIRMKLLEEEQREKGVDLSRFYKKDNDR